MIDLAMMCMKEAGRNAYRDMFLTDGIRYVLRTEKETGKGTVMQDIGFSAPQMKDLTYLVRNGESLANALEMVHGRVLSSMQSAVVDFAALGR